MMNGQKHTRSPELLKSPCLDRCSWRPYASIYRLQWLTHTTYPRAGTLPPGWSVHYVSEGKELGPETIDGKLQRQLFYNSETKEWGRSDPRVTSENLKKMEFDIQEFVLV